MRYMCVNCNTYKNLLKKKRWYKVYSQQYGVNCVGVMTSRDFPVNNTIVLISPGIKSNFLLGSNSAMVLSYVSTQLPYITNNKLYLNMKCEIDKDGIDLLNRCKQM